MRFGCHFVGFSQGRWGDRWLIWVRGHVPTESQNLISVLGPNGAHITKLGLMWRFLHGLCIFMRGLQNGVDPSLDFSSKRFAAVHCGGMRAYIDVCNDI